MKTIRFTIYDQHPKTKEKQRKQKIAFDFAIDHIMALTTARGTGKWPFLYVDDYSEPFELPDQSFDDAKDKLIDASLSEYQNVNKFIPVGSKVLVNYEAVSLVKHLTGEIVLCDDRILNDLDEEMLKTYEILSTIERNKPRKHQWEVSREFFDNFAKMIQTNTDKRSHKITKLFGTLDDKLVATGFLVLINIVLSIILIIMIGKLLYKL